MKIENRAVDAIRPYENNPRKNDHAVDPVAKSIKEFGFRQPIVVDADGVIIIGHTRLLAAKQLGLEKVPVHVARDLSAEQIRALRIADNKTGEFAEWNDKLLEVEFRDLLDCGYDIELTGFSQSELDEIHSEANKNGKTDPDEIPDEPTEPVSSPGDIWQLGRHRLMCGDSRDRGHIDALMNGRVANAVFTDPPYGVEYVGKTKEAKTIQNDGSEGLEELLRDTLGNAAAVCEKGGVWYVAAPAGPQFLPFAVVLTELGIWRQTLVWLKDVMVMGHSDFHYKHEAIFYGWLPGASHRTPPDRKQVSVWPFDRPKVSREHPTMKPVALYEQMFEFSTGAKGLVLDPFAGSGTTLLAAERTGRTCFTMELSPVYTDVVRTRWEKYTGETAVLHRAA